MCLKFGFFFLRTGIDGQVVMKLTFGIRLLGTKTRTRRANKVHSTFYFFSLSFILFSSVLKLISFVLFRSWLMPISPHQFI